MSHAHKLGPDDWDSLISDVCASIGTLTGNVLSEKQRPMVESRLKRRLSDLKLRTPSEYRAYWKAHADQENKTLIGLLTTHFTSFFREFAQFEWLAQELPSIVATAKKEKRNQIKIWSSACSKGQEVWSLCMWLHHHLPAIDPKMEWLVYGSDIDSDSVKEAENAVYHRRELETVPRHLWEGYWVRGKGDISDWYKVKSELRSHAKFSSQNLLDMRMPSTEVFDVIFCRNVLIYFDRQNQEKAVKGLLRYLHPQGALITGVSESLSGYGLQLKTVSPSIYKTPQAEVISFPAQAPSVEREQLPANLNVFCIDDSGPVLTILKRVLQEPGFNLIGTASNGAEAIEKLKTLKPDIITLDLHMPVMDGPTFLKTSGIASSIPVVIMSSVDRDDSFVVDPLFALGVCDFVEKPAMNNLEKSGEELRQKLKMSFQAKKKKVQYQAPSHSVTKRRAPGHVIVNCGYSDMGRVTTFLKAQTWESDEVSIFFDGTQSSLDELKKNTVSHLEKAKKVTWLKASDLLPYSSLPGMWLHFSGGLKDVVGRQKKSSHFLVVEESSIGEAFKASATDLSPVTSFPYLVDKFLSGN